MELTQYYDGLLSRLLAEMPEASVNPSALDPLLVRDNIIFLPQPDPSVAFFNTFQKIKPSQVYVHCGSLTMDDLLQKARQMVRPLLLVCQNPRPLVVGPLKGSKISWSQQFEDHQIASTDLSFDDYCNFLKY